VAERRLTDDVAEAEKMRRYRVLDEQQAEIVGAINARTLGQTVEVLVEAEHKGKWKGRTRTNKLVFFSAPGDWTGRLAQVTVTQTSPWSLQGTLVGAPADPAAAELPADLRRSLSNGRARPAAGDNRIGIRAGRLPRPRPSRPPTRPWPTNARSSISSTATPWPTAPISRSPASAVTTRAGSPNPASHRRHLRLRVGGTHAAGARPARLLAVSFDLGRTFRDDLCADYKGTRDKMPDELSVQIDRIKEVVAIFKIPVLTAENFEADDVLGSAARLAVAEGVDVKIITGDRDLLQLATEHVTINLAGQKLSEAKDYGPAEVQARYGLNPQQFIHYKALVGDKSDNIPGVAGVGEKTATELLQKYDTIDNIYAHLDEIAGRFRAKLEAGRESAYLSLKLSTIVCDVPITLNLDECVVGRYDRQEVFELFRVLEFNSLLRRLPDFSEGAEASGSTATGRRDHRPAGAQQMALFGQPEPGAMTTACCRRSPASPRGPTATTIVTTSRFGRDGGGADQAPFITFDVETTGLDDWRRPRWALP
jgi:5'-3' exonuclease